MNSEYHYKLDILPGFQNLKNLSHRMISLISHGSLQFFSIGNHFNRGDFFVTSKLYFLSSLTSFLFHFINTSVCQHRPYSGIKHQTTKY